jgi:signal transduction histidine kinase
MYARHQAALAELTQAVLANTDLPTLMRQAATLVAHTLAVAYSAIWELCADRSMLVLRAAVGWPEDAVAGTTLEAAATSHIGSTLLGTTPAIVADWPSETRFHQLPALRGHGVISSLAVVIPGPVHPFGSLGVDVDASRMFSDEEVHFLQAVANVLALAIERIQANRAIEQRVEERTREIEEQLVVTAQDRAILEERQRLARDLHDSVTQALYSVTLHAQGARHLLASGEVAMAADALDGLQNTAQEALDEMRLLIFELRPPILEQVGLAAAVQARLSAVEGRASLQTKLIADGIGDLPSPIEQALYRIAQEALNNALRHAHAQRITVQLQQEQTRVILAITDDGGGFDPAVAHKNGGLGLRGIAERVAQLGGTLTLQSAPSAGTQMRVEIAL